MKRLLIIFLIIIISFFVFACSEDDSDSGEKEIPESQYIDNIVGLKVGIYYGGYGNDYMGQNYYAKLGMEKAKEKFRIEVIEKYATKETDKTEIENQLEELANQNDLIIAVGMDIVKGIYDTVAEKHLNKTFVVIGRKSKFYDKENVVAVLFREDEVGFIAGMIAERNSLTKKVSIIAPVPTDTNDKFEMGFSKGARYMDPEIQIITRNGVPEDTIDLIKGRIKSDYDLGFDVTFLLYGFETRDEIIKMAKEHDKYLITLNGNFFEQAPNNIIASISSGFDGAIYEIIKRKAQNNLVDFTVGIKEKINYLIENDKNTKFVDSNIKQKIEKVEKEIIKGKIVTREINEEIGGY